MCASTSPVAGLIEGSESIGMAVAAISGILTDFEVRVWNRNPRKRLAEDAASDNSWKAEPVVCPSRMEGG